MGAPRRSTRPAVWTFTGSLNPWVSTRRCRVLPQMFFPTVEAALAASHGTGFDRLALDESRAGFGVSAHLGSHLPAQAAHRLLPGAVEFPEAEIMVHRFAVGQIMGHLSPRAARSRAAYKTAFTISRREMVSRVASGDGSGMNGARRSHWASVK